MKALCRAIVPAVLVSILLNAGGVAVARAADAKSDKNAPPTGMSQEEMNKMMAFAQPGEQHKAMDKLVGTWKESMKMYMGPGEPTVSTGTATFEWLLGGRYMQEKHTATFNGMPFEGIGITGYDNAKKEYFNLWMDNMGTGVMHLTGHPTDDGKGCTYTGTSFDPMQGKDVNVREEIRYPDATHYTFTMYMPMPGPNGQTQEMKVMEISAEKQ